MRDFAIDSMARERDSPIVKEFSKTFRPSWEEPHSLRFREVR